MIIVYVFILLIVNWWFVVEIGFKFQDQNEELENIQVMMLELMDWRKKIMSRKLTNVRTAVIVFCQRWGLFFKYYMTKRKGNTKTQKIISNVPLLLIVYNLIKNNFDMWKIRDSLLVFCLKIIRTLNCRNLLYEWSQHPVIQLYVNVHQMCIFLLSENFSVL